MIKKNLYLFSILLIALSSCFNQKSQDLEGIAYNKEEYRVRLESCKKFQIKNALLHDQALAFFECSDWNKIHPALYGSLLNIGSQPWDFFIKPINQSFINERIERDRTLFLFNKLEKTGGFDYFTQIVKSLNKQNFYNGLFEITNCFQGKNCRSNDEFLNRDTALWVRETAMGAKDVVKIFTDFLTQVSQQSISTKNTVIKILNELNKIEDIEEDFLSIVDSVFNQTQKDSSVINLLKKFSKEHILSSYLKDLDKQTFEDLLDYMTKPPGLSFKLDIVEGLLDSKIECNEDIIVSTSKRISDLIENMKSASFQELFDSMTQSLAEVKIAQQICPNLNGPFRNTVGNDGEILMTDMLVETLALINNEKNLKLTKILMSSFRDENAIQTVRSLNNKALKVGYEVLSKNRKVFTEIIPLLTTLFDNESWKFIRTIEELLSLSLDRMASDETFLKFKSIWNFFNIEEKKFFIEFVFAHLKSPDQLYSVLDFYSEIGKSVVGKWEALERQYTSEPIESVISYLNIIASNFKGELVLEDFRSFFSKKNVFKIIQVLTNGMQFDPISSRPLAWELANLDTTLFMTESSDYKVSNKMLYCLGQISRDARGLTGWEWLFNSECRSELNVVKNFKQIKSVLELTTEFDGHFDYNNNPEMKLGLLDQYGLFSSNSIGHFLAFLADESGVISKDKFKNIDQILKSLWSDKKLAQSISKIKKTTVDSESISTALGPVLSKLLREASFVARDLEPGQVRSLIKMYRNWLSAEKRNEVRNWKPSINGKFNCSNYHHTRYTGLNCPDSTTVAETISTMAGELTRKTGADHTAVELLLNIFSSGQPNYPETQALFGDNKFTLSQIIDMMVDLDKTSNSEDYNFMSDLLFEKHDLDLLNYKTSEIKSNFEPKTEAFTILQKVESVTRNVRFDSNYLGAHFLNSIVFSPEYDDLVKKKWSLMRKCVGVKFCGKWMSKNDVKLAQNSVAFFKGLTEINSDSFRHSDGFRMFFSPFVLSSQPEAQRATMFSKKVLGIKLDLPVLLSRSQLANHNGRILTKLTMVSFFTNLARLINRNLDTHKIDKEELLSLSSFINLNNGMLKKADFTKLLQTTNSILSYLKTNEGEQKLVEWIDFLNNLNDESYVYLENALIKIGSMVSQSASINITLDTLEILIRELTPKPFLAILNNDFGKYISKNLYELSSFLFYYFENDNDARNLIEHISSKFLYYFYHDLVAVDGDIDYVTDINNLISKLEKSPSAQVEFKQLLVNMDEFKVTNEKRIDVLLSDLEQWLKYKSKEVEYLKLITSEKVCDGTKCYNNPHYDELYKLVDFVFLNDKLDGYNKLKNLYESFDEDEIDEMLDHLHQSITVDNHLK